MEYINNKITQVKQILSNTNDAVAKKYFNLLGYKHNTTLTNSNFFHFATEAYIITSIKAYENDLNEERKKNKKDNEENSYIYVEYTEGEIKKALMHNIVCFDDFLDTLELLIGEKTSETSSNSVKFSTAKLAKLFLINVEYEKSAFKHSRNGIDNNIHNNEALNEKNLNLETLNLDNFFRRVVNYTLNELNNEKGEEKSLDLLEVYERYNDLVSGLSLERFVEEYKNRMAANDKTKKLTFCVQNPCEVFYFYCQSSIKDLVYDLYCFNQQSAYAFYIALALIRHQVNSQSNRLQKLYYIYVKKNYKTIRNSLEKSDKLSNLKSECENKILSFKDWAQLNYTNYSLAAKENFTYYKNNANSIYTNNKESLVKNLNNFYASEYVQKNIDFLNKKVYTPINNRVNSLFASKSYSYVVNTYSSGRKKFDEIREQVILKIAKTYNITKERAEKYVAVTYDGFSRVGVVQVFYDKMKTNSDKFMKMAENISVVIRENNVEQLKKVANDAYVFGKSSVMQTYKKFLGIATGNSSSEDKKDSNSNNDDQKEKKKEESEKKEIKDEENNLNHNESTENKKNEEKNSNTSNNTPEKERKASKISEKSEKSEKRVEEDNESYRSQSSNAEVDA